MATETTDIGSAAVNNAPLVKPAGEVVEAASNGEIGSLAANVGSFAMEAAGAAADPLNALISAGLGFLEDVCQPVKDCLEQVTGNPDSLKTNKEAFGEVSESIKKLGEDLENITKSGFQNWSGDAKDKATEAIETFVQGVDGTANNATDIASLLGISATLMDAAKDIINGILSTLIEWLIVTWVAALACSWFTFGASDAAAGAATAVESSVEGANAAEKVEETGSFIDRIVNIIKDIISKLKSFAQEVSKNHSLLKEGKEVLPAAEKDGAKAAEGAAGKAGGEAGKAGEAVSDADKPGFFANKFNEAKEGIQHPIKGLQDTAIDMNKSGSFSGYLNTPEESGLSPLQDMAADAGLQTGGKIVGALDDNAGDQEDGPGGTDSATISQDLHG
jgi:uncharacterized protein YukE